MRTAIILIGLLSFSALTSTLRAQVAIDEIHFPDPLFRKYVTEHFNHDTIPDTLSVAELNSIKNIYVQGDSINSLQGIEYFYNLKYIGCSNNNLQHIDLSHNAELQRIDCCYNNLTSLDLSHNYNIQSVSCTNNMLTSILLPDS